MKIKHIIPALGLLLMLGACSSEEPQPTPANPDEPTLVEGDTYLAFTMTTGSRADASDPYASASDWDAYIRTDVKPYSIHTYLFVFITPEGGTAERLTDIIALRLDGDNVKLYCNITPLIEGNKLKVGQKFRIDVFANVANSNDNIAASTRFNTSFTFQYMMDIESSLNNQGPVMPMYGFLSGLSVSDKNTSGVITCDGQLKMLRAAHCIEVINDASGWEFAGVPVMYGTNQLCFTGFVSPIAHEDSVKVLDNRVHERLDLGDVPYGIQDMTEGETFRKNAGLKFPGAPCDTLHNDHLYLKEDFKDKMGRKGYRIYLPEQQSEVGNTEPLRIFVKLKQSSNGEEVTSSGNLYFDKNNHTTYYFHRNYKTRFIIRSAEPDRGVGYQVELDEETPINIPIFS